MKSKESSRRPFFEKFPCAICSNSTSNPVDKIGIGN